MPSNALTYIHLMLISLLILLTAGCTRDIKDTPVEFEELSSEYDPQMSPSELEIFKTKAINALVQKYKTPSQLKRGEISVINLSERPCLTIPEKIHPSTISEPEPENKNLKKVQQYSQLKIKSEEVKGKTLKVPPNAAAVEKTVEKATTTKTDYILPIRGEYALSDPKKPDGGVKIITDSNASIVAIAPGKIIFIGSIKGLGKVILIEHPEQFIAAYANVSDIFVRVQQSVQQGQKIATAPATPSKKAEIHFELRKGNKRLNPLEHLPKP